MRILFYLPVVTPWWFEKIIEPMMRTLAGAHEVHVLAPVPWANTGIGPAELQRCTDLPDIRWYIMDGPDHPSTRTVPEARDDLIAFVRDLAPDHVFCRSADYETVRHFPGVVRLVMEGRLEPFAPPPYWCVLPDRPLDQGMWPALPDADRTRLSAMIDPAWRRLRALNTPTPGTREHVFARCGIPGDRPALLVPLEYQNVENFFAIHRLDPRPNHEIVAELARAVGPDFTLVLTNHPLNDLHVDNAPLLATVAALDNVVLAPPTIGTQPATKVLASVADGMIQGDSKTFALAAFFGTPMLRRSRFASGEWLNAYTALDPFLEDVANGRARRAAEADAQAWFGFYMANEVFDPQDAALTPGQLLDHARRPVDPGRWEAGIERLRRAAPSLFAD